VLVDRLWPRGLSKEVVDYDEWAKGGHAEHEPATMVRARPGQVRHVLRPLPPRAGRCRPLLTQSLTYRGGRNASGSFSSRATRDVEHSGATVLRGVIEHGGPGSRRRVERPVRDRGARPCFDLFSACRRCGAAPTRLVVDPAPWNGMSWTPSSSHWPFGWPLRAPLIVGLRALDSERIDVPLASLLAPRWSGHEGGPCLWRRARSRPQTADELQEELRDLLSLAVVGDHVPMGIGWRPGFGDDFKWLGQRLWTMAGMRRQVSNAGSWSWVWARWSVALRW